MFGSQNNKILALYIAHDPAADDDLYLFKAPTQMEIVSASFACNNAVAANTANYFDLALYNGGTAGTATGAIAGTIGGTVGWDAKTPKDFTVSNGTITANQIVYLRYNEEGTGTFGAGVLQINYREGIA